MSALGGRSESRESGCGRRNEKEQPRGGHSGDERMEGNGVKVSERNARTMSSRKGGRGQTLLPKHQT